MQERGIDGDDAQEAFEQLRNAASQSQIIVKKANYVTQNTGVEATLRSGRSLALR